MKNGQKVRWEFREKRRLSLWSKLLGKVHADDQLSNFPVVVNDLGIL